MTIKNTVQTLLPVLALASASTYAIPEIPEEDGWSGFIGAGIGAGTSENNLWAEVAGVDLGKKSISSLNSSPDDEDIALPSAFFEVAYKFKDMPTQVYLNNVMADHATFDLETSLLINAGLRQGIGEAGVIDIAFGGSSVALDVWKDPYLVGDDRGNTEQTQSGVEIIWDEIFGSGFEVALSAREIEVDDERSGDALGLDNRERRLLSREGNINRLDLTYDWKLNDQHYLTPGIAYVDRDLDGEALGEDGVMVQLQHVYDGSGWSLVSGIYFQQLESDTRNPIYNKQGETDTLGVSTALLLPEPFGLEGWTANIGGVYYEGDSNIDFYDTKFGVVSAGMLYRFD